MSDAIHLERCDPSRNMARFYRLELCQTLFGEVVLIRRWGRKGTEGHVREALFEDQDEGESLLRKWVQAKERRGYWAVGRDHVSRERSWKKTYGEA